MTVEEVKNVPYSVKQRIIKLTPEEIETLKKIAQGESNNESTNSRVQLFSLREKPRNPYELPLGRFSVYD